MELTCQDSMRLPAACTVIPEDEMVYINGGELTTGVYNIGKYTITVDWPTVAQRAGIFATNVCVNFLILLGQGAFDSAASGMKDGRADGLTTGGVIGNYWRNQSTFGRVATFAVGTLAGYYLYIQAYNLITSVISTYNELKAAYQQATAQDTMVSSTAALTAA